MDLKLLDKKGKRLADKKFATLHFTGTLIQDIRKYLKTGDKVYFSFHTQNTYGTGLYFSIFNEFTHKSNIPIRKLPEYIEGISVAKLEQFNETYRLMNSRDYDTYTLPDK